MPGLFGSLVSGLRRGEVKVAEASALTGLFSQPNVRSGVSVNHVTGASGPAAVLLGAAQEKGRTRQASLRVLCFDGATTVHTDAEGLHPGPWAVSVKVSLDGGRFVDGSWQPSAGGGSLELSGNRAIAFLVNLYGKAELRLAVVRPLSVPFLITFAVSGAEPSLRPLAERCQWSAGPAFSEAGR